MWFGLEDVTLYDWTHLCKKNFTSEPCDLSLIDLHSEATKICTGTRQSCSSLIPYAHQPHCLPSTLTQWCASADPPTRMLPTLLPHYHLHRFFHSDTHSVWCCSGCQMGGSLHCAALEQTIQQRSFSRDSQHSKEGASCQRIYWYQVIRSCVQKTRKYTVSRNVLNLV